MAYEADLERKITGALNGYKNGTKTEVEVVTLIKKLRESNSGLADDYNKKLLIAIKAKK